MFMRESSLFGFLYLYFTEVLTFKTKQDSVSRSSKKLNLVSHLYPTPKQTHKQHTEPLPYKTEILQKRNYFYRKIRATKLSTPKQR